MEQSGVEWIWSGIKLEWSGVEWSGVEMCVYSSTLTPS